jgi:hypothetical protein
LAALVEDEAINLHTTQYDLDAVNDVTGKLEHGGIDMP